MVPGQNLNIRDLTILKEDGLPPMKWKFVKLTNTHPRENGIVRVVSVTTSSGTMFKLPVIKLSLLPTNNDEECI